MDLLILWRQQQLVNKGVHTSKDRGIGGTSGLGFHIRPPTMSTSCDRWWKIWPRCKINTLDISSSLLYFYSCYLQKFSLIILFIDCCDFLAIAVALRFTICCVCCSVVFCCPITFGRVGIKWAVFFWCNFDTGKWSNFGYFSTVGFHVNDEAILENIMTYF